MSVGFEARDASTDTGRDTIPTTGHFSTLTSSQRKAFVEFKELCQKNNVYWPTSALDSSSTGEANDDHTLLQYLRARQYDPKAAFKQYSTSNTWRRNHHLDDEYDNVDIEKFERMRRMLPNWTGRRDKTGVPVFVYVVSEIRTEDVLKVGKEDPELTTVFYPAEYVTRFVQPLCGKLHGDNSIDRSTNIIDLSGVGIRQFWNLRNLLQTSSRMATAHYPETVERIFVVGAPSFFPTVWGFITKWFDPATTSKIKILSTSEVTSTMSEYIDPSNLPKRFGGNLDWEFGMHPLLDDEAKALVGDLAKEWVEGPIRYISRGDDKEEIIALGSESGEIRRQVLAKPTEERARASKIDLEKTCPLGDSEYIATAIVT